MWSSKWIAGLLVTAVASAGCFAEPDEETNESSSAIVQGTPLVIHMAFVQKAGAGGKTQPDGPATARLIVAGVENIMVSSQPFPHEANVAWKNAKGKLAGHLPLVRIIADLERGVADPIAVRLAEGWDYVGIDELETNKAAKVADGKPFAQKFKNLIEAHSGKVILYGNTYNMIGVPIATQNRYRQFTGVLRACATHCKAFASQIYLSTGEAFPPNRGIAKKSGCANGIRCIGWTARVLQSIAPGINSKLVTVLDVRSRNKPSSNPDSYCAGGRGGALQREIAKVRALRRKGVGRGFGTYSLNTLNGDDVPSVSTKNAFTACARRGAAGLPGSTSLKPLTVETSLEPTDLDPADAALDNDPEIANDWDPDFVEDASSLPEFPKPSQCGLLKPGEALAPGDAVTACDGLSFLVHQGDGNVVLYEKYPDKVVPVWSTKTDGNVTGAFVMQGDGNAVLYGPSWEVYWAAGTNGNDGARLQVQDDCKAVVATTANTAAWASNSACRYEGVDANEGFILSSFKAYNPDVVAYGSSVGWTDANYINYWNVNYDSSRCRQASPAFHAAHYLAANGDVNAAYGGSCVSAMNHWLSHGNREGRRSSAQFDPRYYLAANPDLAAAYGPHNYGKAAWHFIHAGNSEGRRATP